MRADAQYRHQGKDIDLNDMAKQIEKQGNYSICDSRTLPFTSAANSKVVSRGPSGGQLEFELEKQQTHNVVFNFSRPIKPL